MYLKFKVARVCPLAVLLIWLVAVLTLLHMIDLARSDA